MNPETILGATLFVLIYTACIYALIVGKERKK